MAQGQDFSAEEEGFEPTDPLRDRRFSKPNLQDHGDAHETTIKQGVSSSSRVPATLTESDESGLTKALVFPSGTLRDVSPNGLEAALARTLDAATKAEQWDVVRTILAQLGGRGRG